MIAEANVPGVINLKTFIDLWNATIRMKKPMNIYL
jgi:hypothetical protein